MLQSARVLDVSPEVTTMKACVLIDVGRLEVREVSRPQVSPRGVLVQVAAVGICGTDTHIFSGHANYNMDNHGRSIPLAVEPQILGHEINGYVAEKGSEVRDLEVGDHVVIDQGLNCVSMERTPVCEYCRTGDSHQCEFYREHGITGLPGGLADFIAVPAVNAVPIRSGLNRRKRRWLNHLAASFIRLTQSKRRTLVMLSMPIHWIGGCAPC